MIILQAWISQKEKIGFLSGCLHFQFWIEKELNFEKQILSDMFLDIIEFQQIPFPISYGT